MGTTRIRSSTILKYYNWWKSKYSKGIPPKFLADLVYEVGGYWSYLDNYYQAIRYSQSFNKNETDYELANTDSKGKIKQEWRRSYKNNSWAGYSWTLVMPEFPSKNQIYICSFS